MEALFGKLLAYEHELNQQSLGEENERKKRSIALKTSLAKELNDDSSSEDEEEESLNLLAKKFNKFLRRKRDRKLNRNFKKPENASGSNLTCFECGKPGHIKTDCP